MRRAPLQMLQGGALHLDERLLAGGVHDLKNESPAGRDQMKIIVILAGQTLRRAVKTKDIARNMDCFCFLHWLGGLNFRHHSHEFYLHRRGKVFCKMSAPWVPHPSRFLPRVGRDTRGEDEGSGTHLPVGRAFFRAFDSLGRGS
jgi:hypothetical protein